MEENQFRANYRVKVADESREYIVHPLGLVFRPEIIYLVCTLWDYDDIKQLALHRFESCEILKQRRNAPEEFNLDDYIAEGGFSYPVEEKPIKLQVLFDSQTAAHLYETPLSENQILSENDDGRILLKATVEDTSELHWWLLGFGDCVEVLKPEKLRNLFSKKIKNLADRYQVYPQEILRPKITDT